MAMTYKEQPENNYYYLTYITDSTPLRAIQAASNGIQLLNSGFTVVRDVGNNALYADAALRQAIEQGWLPGPTVIPSGPMIGSTGGQFWPTPEMYKYHNIMFPEYIDANSPDEIVRAVRENMLFGARTIKLCIDCKPWGYSVEDIKLAISEAAKGGCKVEGHVQTPEGAQRAIDAGIYIIAHNNALTPEHHRQMAEKGIFLTGTDTPFTPYRGSEPAFKRTVANLRDAWEKKVPLTFSTDFDYWNERMKDPKTGEWLSRGDLTINFLETWKAAGIPQADILRAMTIQGYKAANIINERGPIKPGLLCRPDRGPGQSSCRHRCLAQRSTRDEERHGVQKGWRHDAGEVFPPGPGQDTQRPMESLTGGACPRLPFWLPRRGSWLRGAGSYPEIPAPEAHKR